MTETYKIKKIAMSTYSKPLENWWILSMKNVITKSRITKGINWRINASELLKNPMSPSCRKTNCNPKIKVKFKLNTTSNFSINGFLGISFWFKEVVELPPKGVSFMSLTVKSSNEDLTSPPFYSSISDIVYIFWNGKCE